MFRKVWGKSDDVRQHNHNAELAWDHVTKGIKLNQLQQFDRAIQEFGQAISLDQNCADAYANRAVSLQMMGFLRPALADINMALRFQQNEPFWCGMRAYLCVNTGNWNQVIADCETLLSSKDIPLEVRCMNLGMCIWAKQQNNDNSWTTLLDNYIQLVKERAKANPALLEAAPIALIAREIGMESVFMSFAYGAMAQKKYPEAVENFTNALNINPNNSFALLNRGIAHLRQQNLPCGLQDFSKAIAVDGSFADPYYFRAISYSIVGDHPKAKTDFTQYIKLGGDSSLVQKKISAKWSVNSKHDI